MENFAIKPIGDLIGRDIDFGLCIFDIADELIEVSYALQQCQTINLSLICWKRISMRAQ